jgi:hypothetical protein
MSNILGNNRFRIVAVHDLFRFICAEAGIERRLTAARWLLRRSVAESRAARRRTSSRAFSMRTITRGRPVGLSSARMVHCSLTTSETWFGGYQVARRSLPVIESHH